MCKDIYSGVNQMPSKSTEMKKKDKIKYKI